MYTVNKVWYIVICISNVRLPSVRSCLLSDGRWTAHDRKYVSHHRNSSSRPQRNSASAPWFRHQSKLYRQRAPNVCSTRSYQVSEVHRQNFQRIHKQVMFNILIIFPLCICWFQNQGCWRIIKVWCWSRERKFKEWGIFMF